VALLSIPRADIGIPGVRTAQPICQYADKGWMAQTRKRRLSPTAMRVRRRWMGAVAALFAAVALAGGAATLRSSPQSARRVPLSDVVGDITGHRVAVAHLDDGSRLVTVALIDGRHVAASYPDGYGTELTKALIGAGSTIDAKPVATVPLGRQVLVNALPVLLLLGALIWFMRNRAGAGAFKRGKNAAEVPDTRFSDVAGADETVAELAEVVAYLHNPERFRAAGAKVPRGFLLVGPPGTGKTLLARAVAGEADVPFFALSGSDFVETYVGVGAARVRKVFERARRCDRAIVFIDEIDAIGKARGSGRGNGGNDERENTLNALLVEMDGFEYSNVILLGATNRVDVLDPALIRAGRFDRQIPVSAPDRVGRTRILALHASACDLAMDVDLVSLGRRTPGFTGADLACLVNEAALETAREGSTRVTGAHLDAALATTMLGKERRSAVVTERDRRITAYHEAGHAVAALVHADVEDPVSVTIVPRGSAGGVTWMGGNDNAYLTRSEASGRLTVALAGRAAEERLLDGDFTQGAASDLLHATELATAMVTSYGMSEHGLASVSPEGLSFGAIADGVNAEVNRMLAAALHQARQLLESHGPLLAAVAAVLLEEETLSLIHLQQLRGNFQPVG
jgi:cell division protease FtsH